MSYFGYMTRYLLFSKIKFDDILAICTSKMIPNHPMALRGLGQIFISTRFYHLLYYNLLVFKKDSIGTKPV